jgi:hypothetical protein
MDWLDSLTSIEINAFTNQFIEAYYAKDKEYHNFLKTPEAIQLIDAKIKLHSNHLDTPDLKTLQTLIKYRKYAKKELTTALTDCVHHNYVEGANYLMDQQVNPNQNIYGNIDFQNYNLNIIRRLFIRLHPTKADLKQLASHGDERIQEVIREWLSQ